MCWMGIYYFFANSYVLKTFHLKSKLTSRILSTFDMVEMHTNHRFIGFTTVRSSVSGHSLLLPSEENWTRSKAFCRWRRRAAKFCRWSGWIARKSMIMVINLLIVATTGKCKLWKHRNCFFKRPSCLIHFWGRVRHTIRKVKFLSKNSILTKNPTFSQVFRPNLFDNFSREIKIVNS